MKLVLGILASSSICYAGWDCWGLFKKITPTLDVQLEHLLSPETCEVPETVDLKHVEQWMGVYNYHDLRSKAYGHAHQVIEFTFRHGDIMDLCKKWGMNYQGGDFSKMRTKLLRKMGEAELKILLYQSVSYG